MKHSLRLARMARMDLTPNPAARYPGDADQHALNLFPELPADDSPTAVFAPVRLDPPPAPTPDPPASELASACDAELPGSEGEHLLQLAYGSRKRANQFYRDQVCARLNDEMIAFVQRMEMAFIATADAHGEADCSFRAGPPGFIQVLSDQQIAYPEYRGNGVLASLGNISENPHVGIMLIDFVQDRIGLHINGKATIVEDTDLRAAHSGLPEETVRGRIPERWVVVDIDEAYIHCRKHIPLMQKADADQAWGTDDVKRKGGDYFGVRKSRKQANH